MLTCGNLNGRLIGFQDNKYFIEGLGSLLGISGPNPADNTEAPPNSEDCYGFINLESGNYILFSDERNARLYIKGRASKMYVYSIDSTQVAPFPLPAPSEPIEVTPPTVEEVMIKLQEEVEQKKKLAVTSTGSEGNNREDTEETKDDSESEESKEDDEAEEDDYKSDEPAELPEEDFATTANLLRKDIENLNPDNLQVSVDKKNAKLAKICLPNIPIEEKMYISSHISLEKAQKMLEGCVNKDKDLIKVYDEYEFQSQIEARIFDYLLAKKPSKDIMEIARFIYTAGVASQLLQKAEEEKKEKEEKESSAEVASASTSEESDQSSESEQTEETDLSFESTEPLPVKPTQSTELSQVEPTQPSQPSPVETTQPTKLSTMESTQPTEPSLVAPTQSSEPPLVTKGKLGIINLDTLSDEEFRKIMEDRDKETLQSIESLGILFDELIDSLDKSELFRVPTPSIDEANSELESLTQLDKGESESLTQSDKGASEYLNLTEAEKEALLGNLVSSSKEESVSKPNRDVVSNRVKLVEPKESSALYYNDYKIESNPYIGFDEINRILQEYLPFMMSFRSKYPNLPFTTEEACCYYHHQVNSIMKLQDILNNSVVHQRVLDFSYTIELKVINREWVFCAEKKTRTKKTAEAKVAKETKQMKTTKPIIPASDVSMEDIDSSNPLELLTNDYMARINDPILYEFISLKLVYYDKVISALREKLKEDSKGRRTQLTEEATKISEELKRTEQILLDVNTSKEKLQAALDKMLELHRSELAVAKLEYKSREEELSKQYEDTCRRLNSETSEAIESLRNEYLSKLGKLTEKHENEMDKKTKEHEREIKKLIGKHDKEVAELQKELSRANAYMTEKEESFSEEIHNLKEELNLVNRSVDYWKDKHSAETADMFEKGKEAAFSEYQTQILNIQKKYEVDTEELKGFYNRKIEEAKEFYLKTVGEESRSLEEEKIKFTNALIEEYNSKKTSDDIARAQSIQKLQQVLDMRTSELKAAQERLDSGEVISKAEHERVIRDLKESYADLARSVSDTENRNLELSNKLVDAQSNSLREVVNFIQQGEIGRAVLLAQSIEVK